VPHVPVRSVFRPLVAVALTVGTLAACASSGGEKGSAAPATSPPSVVLTEPAQQPVTRFPVGVKYARVAFDTYKPYLTKLGGGSGTFYEATWCDVEPTEGTYDWSELDEVTAQAESVGQELMLKVRVGSCWATGGQIGEARGAKAKTASTTPADMAKYDAFLNALVARYGARGVKEWAIENEVNNTAQWAGTPEEYVALVEHAADVIRAEQPDAVILDSGISSPTMGTGIVVDLLAQNKPDEALAAYQRYYARRHTSRTKDYPAISTQAELQKLVATDKWKYNEAMIEATLGLANDGVIDRLQTHFYERWDAAPLLVGFLRSKIPADMPIEAWEVGLFDVDDAMPEAQLSEEVTKTVSQLLAYGVARVLWLPLAADPNGTGGEEKRFGLLEPDGTPRLVANAYEQLVKVTTGATLQPLDSKGLMGFVSRQGDKATVVAWAAEAPVPADWATGASALGSTTTTAGGATGIGTSPVMVEVPVAQAAQLSGAPG
jgi:hypothetical protein